MKDPTRGFFGSESKSRPQLIGRGLMILALLRYVVSNRGAEEIIRFLVECALIGAGVLFALFVQFLFRIRKISRIREA